MKFRLFDLFWGTPRKNRKRSVVSARPQLEVLEDRITPTLLNHGGPVLASIQAQAVYLGADWNGATPFDGFLTTTVNGTTTAPAPYLAMLKNAGFTGVTGAGNTLSDVNDAVPLSSTVTDAAIQAELKTQIDNNTLHPNANTLYFVFVQPNVVVSFGNGQDSTNTFLAYHSSFTYNGSQVRYAVIPNHGTAGNAQDPWLTSAFDSMTVAASHEMAEAITDPDGTTWFDRSGNEVGDVVNGSTVYLNSYAVQREGSIPASLSNFLPMTPAGSKASHAATFSIVSGALDVSEDGGGTWTAIANPSGENGHVVSFSTQGIDDFGQPMTDVLFSDGNAYEYHDFAANNPTATQNPTFFPWTSLGGNVKQAVAGQAVSYVLLTNGNLGEYVDPNYSTYYYGYGVNPGSRHGVIASGVTSIVAAGTDQLGVNAVEYTSTVHGKTTTYEWRDVNGQASTSTAGFKPAGTSAISTGNFGVGAPGLSLDDVDTPVSSPAQPVRTVTRTNPSPAPFLLVSTGPVVLLATNVAPVAATVVQTTRLPDAGVTAQGSVLLFYRAASGIGETGNLPDDEVEADPVVPCDVSLLPDALLGKPAAPAQPRGEELATVYHEASQPLVVADEVWIAWGEADSLPFQDEASSPILGLAAAAFLPSVLFSQRRSRRGMDRTEKCRIW